MDWQKINLNDRIRFKLTQHGVRFLRKNHPDIKLERGKGRWVEMTLWEFASLFGHVMTIGFNPPVKPDVKIKIED